MRKEESRGREPGELWPFLAIAFLLPLMAAGLGKLTENPAAKLIFYGLQGASPSLAALLLLGQKKALGPLFGRIFPKKRPLSAVGLPFLLAFAAMAAGKALFCLWRGTPFALQPLSASQMLILLWALIAEELGWRGYLQPLLCRRMKRPRLAPLAVGAVWGLWHYHFFLFSGLEAPLLWFFAGCIAESCLYAGLLRKTECLLSAMLYHFFWNLFLRLFAVGPADNRGDPLAYCLMTLTEMAILGAALLLQRRKAAGRSGNG